MLGSAYRYANLLFIKTVAEAMQTPCQSCQSSEDQSTYSALLFLVLLSHVMAHAAVYTIQVKLIRHAYYTVNLPLNLSCTEA